METLRWILLGVKILAEILQMPEVQNLIRQVAADSSNDITRGDARRAILASSVNSAAGRQILSVPKSISSDPQARSLLDLDVQAE